MKTVIYNHSKAFKLRIIRGRSRKEADKVAILVGGRLIGRVIYNIEEGRMEIELLDGVEVVL